MLLHINWLFSTRIVVIKIFQKGQIPGGSPQDGDDRSWNWVIH